MDIKREGVARKKRIRMAVYIVLATACVGTVSWYLSKLKPAAPTVERGTIWPGTVKRGPIVLDVHGTGTLIPEEIQWIPASSEGQITKVLAKSGEKVRPDSVLMVLTNPDMELAANDLDWQVKQAEATYTETKVALQSQKLNQQSVVASVGSDLKTAQLTKDRDQALQKMKLKSEMDVNLSVAKFEELTQKYDIEKKRFEIQTESEDAQLGSLKVQIEKLQAQSQLSKKKLADLVIRAGTDGVLQELSLQVGQRVHPGDVLAKVAQPWKLKAELKIAETQAKDLQLGLMAQIDTRNGIIPAHVVRIDPNVVNGTRTVDCKLDGALPAGAVPDLSVDGTVEIARLPDVMYVDRPVSGQPNSTVSLFKIDEDNKGASRVTVKFGRSSVTNIEVLEGLKVGDQVILSDMSLQDQSSRIRFN